MFEIHGLILALHHDARFLRNPGSVERARLGFERLLAHSLQTTTSGPVPDATPLRSKEARSRR